MTGHAYGIKTESGVEVLVHIGINTVKMKGEGFAPAVKKGDTVKVIDSGSAGMVMGAAAMAAAKLAQEGASLEECHAALDGVNGRLRWV